MKKLVFPFIGILMFGLSGCFDNGGENIQTYTYVPAIVDLSFEYGLFLKTPYGKVIPTGTQNLPDWGDVVLAFFTVNYDRQGSTEYTTVSDFDYGKVLEATAIATTGGQSTTGDFDLPIEDIDVLGWVDYLWFFIFSHKEVNKDDFLFYEMTYDNDEPIVYLRAKKSSTGFIKGVSVCAFDMNYFFFRHKDADNKVRFSIQYKTGVDSEGNDEFKPFLDHLGNSTIEILVE